MLAAAAGLVAPVGPCLFDLQHRSLREREGRRGLPRPQPGFSLAKSALRTLGRPARRRAAFLLNKPERRARLLSLEEVRHPAKW